MASCNIWTDQYRKLITTTNIENYLSYEISYVVMILLTALDTTNRFQTIFQIYDHIPQKRKKEIFATLFVISKITRLDLFNYLYRTPNIILDILSLVHKKIDNNKYILKDKPDKFLSPKYPSIRNSC